MLKHIRLFYVKNLYSLNKVKVLFNLNNAIFNKQNFKRSYS